MTKELKKIINNISWWIPFRNKRDHLRNCLIDNIEKTCNNISVNTFNRAAEIFSVEKNTEKQKEIMGKNLCLIEIEIASYCNRTCWFCPNSFIDRHTNHIELKEELYLKIINNLKEINYSNLISFHRFNEPLADRKLIIKRISQAREALPNAKLSIFTNGDYLTKDYLEELRIAGINNILMSYYSKEDNQFDLYNVIKPSMNKIMEKLDLNYQVIKEDFTYYAIKIDYYDLNFIYQAKNFEKIGSDRGGSINSVHIKREDIRNYGCFYPISDLYIDYNGLIMPCCNMRSDIEAHKPYILGDIHNNNLFEIFTGEKMVNMRKYLYSDTVKEGPCKHCHYRTDYYVNRLSNL